MVLLLQGFSWRESQVSTVYAALSSAPPVSTTVHKSLGQELELVLELSGSAELGPNGIQDLFCKTQLLTTLGLLLLLLFNSLETTHISSNSKAEMELGSYNRKPLSNDTQYVPTAMPNILHILLPSWVGFQNYYLSFTDAELEVEKKDEVRCPSPWSYY